MWRAEEELYFLKFNLQNVIVINFYLLFLKKIYLYLQTIATEFNPETAKTKLSTGTILPSSVCHLIKTFLKKIIRGFVIVFHCCHSS